MTCTAVSHQGTIREPAASLLRTSGSKQRKALWVFRRRKLHRDSRQASEFLLIYNKNTQEW